MPARLLAHLTIVHQVANIILDWLEKTYPSLIIDKKLYVLNLLPMILGK